MKNKTLFFLIASALLILILGCEPTVGEQGAQGVSGIISVEVSTVEQLTKALSDPIIRVVTIVPGTPSTLTLTENLLIVPSKRLVIAENVKLTTVDVTNNGSISNFGTLNSTGIITNAGLIANAGIMTINEIKSTGIVNNQIITSNDDQLELGTGDMTITTVTSLANLINTGKVEILTDLLDGATANITLLGANGTLKIYQTTIIGKTDSLFSLEKSTFLNVAILGTPTPTPNNYSYTVNTGKMTSNRDLLVSATNKIDLKNKAILYIAAGAFNSGGQLTGTQDTQVTFKLTTPTITTSNGFVAGSNVPFLGVYTPFISTTTSSAIWSLNVATIQALKAANDLTGITNVLITADITTTTDITLVSTIKITVGKATLTVLGTLHSPTATSVLASATADEGLLDLKIGAKITGALPAGITGVTLDTAVTTAIAFTASGTSNQWKPKP